MADRVKPEEEIFLVAYPYFNVNEMLVVEELYKVAVESTSRKLLIFNGELDRIRSGCFLIWFLLNEQRLSPILLSEAGSANQDLPSQVGNCILCSQFQREQGRNSFQLEGEAHSRIKQRNEQWIVLSLNIVSSEDIQV